MFVVFVLNFLLFVLPPLVLAQLVLESESQQSLLQYGSAQAAQSFLLSVPTGETVTAVTLSTQDNDVLTSHNIFFSQVSQGVYNISVDLFFDGMPGEVQYSVVATTQSPDGTENRSQLSTTHSVFGVAFYETVDGERRVVSGDESDGIQFPSFTTPESSPRVFRASTHAPAGASLGGKPFIRSARGTAEDPLLLESGIEVSGTELSLSVSPYRTGSVIVTLEFADLQIDGESYETVVRVTVPDVPSPPVVISQEGELVAEIAPNGTAEFQLEMFNAADFPVMKALVGDSVFEASREGSELLEFDQKVRFVGSIDEGTFPLTVQVERDNEASDVVMLEDVSLTFERASVDKVLGGGSAIGTGTNVGLIVGLSVLGLVLLVALVGVLAIFRSRRRSEEAEALAEEPTMEAEDVGGFGIARDVYGRGSIAV